MTSASVVESEGNKRRGLPREHGEVSQEVEIWSPDHRTIGSSSRNLFGPKVSRKLTRHSSTTSHRLPTANSSPTAAAHEPGRFKQFSPARLREKPSKLKFGSSSGGSTSSYSVLPATLAGSWKKGKLTLRDNDVLYILEDGALLHPLRTSALKPTDVRPVDESLLGRHNVLGIFALPSNFAGGRGSEWDAASPLSPSADSSSLDTTSPLVTPILLCFPSSIKMRHWQALLRCCGTSDIYGSSSSIPKGGTHRWHRQIDVHISAFRLLHPAVPAASPSPTRPQEISLPLVATSEAPPSPTNALSRIKSTISDASARQDGDDSGEIRPKPRPAVLERSTSAMSQASITSTASGDLSATSYDDSYATGTGSTAGPISGGGAPDTVSSYGSQTQLTGSAKLEQARKERDRESSSAPSAPSAPSINFTSLCCTLLCDDVILGRTEARNPHTASGSVSWDDPTITLYNPPAPKSLRIDLLAGLSGARGHQHKVMTLGSVELPIDTMRRGEDIEGWFPVWNSASRDIGYPLSSLGDECIGELNCKIKVEELAVLQRRKYKDIERILNQQDLAQLITGLAYHLNESTLMDHLVEIFTSSGTIADRLINLIDAEQPTWGKAPLELLFRSHSLVTRCLEKFQRIHCQHWLDASIGDLVRRICEERISVDSDAVQASNEGVPTLAMNSKDADTLHSWVVAIWESIYVNRSKCPTDLQRILTKVRQATNAAFPSQGPSAGVQGVGCFVFLRLMCAAMINPQLYGLTATMPEPEVGKTLKSIAKVLNALANKRGSTAHYDQDLGQLNDFLHEQSNAFDDYIVSVSSHIETAPSTEADRSLGHTASSSSTQANKPKPGRGDVNEILLQRTVDKKSSHLPLLHRESILTGPYMLDLPAALAAFVNYVARSTDACILDGVGHRQGVEKRTVGSTVQSLVEACYELEGLVGYYIDRAGFDPQPLSLVEWAQVTTHSTSTPYSVVATGRDLVSRPSVAVLSGIQAETTSRGPTGGSASADQQQQKKLTSSRRRATVSAAPNRVVPPPPLVGLAGQGESEAQRQQLINTLSRQHQLHQPSPNGRGTRPGTSSGQSLRRRSMDTALSTSASLPQAIAISEQHRSFGGGGGGGGAGGSGGDGKKPRWWKRIV